MSSLSLDVQRAEELVIFKVVHADGGRPMDGFDKTKESRVHSLLHKAGIEQANKFLRDFGCIIPPFLIDQSERARGTTTASSARFCVRHQITSTTARWLGSLVAWQAEPQA